MTLARVEGIRARGWSKLELDAVRDRIRGAMLGGLCGDALGAGFEGQHEVSVGDWCRRRDGAEMLRYTGHSLLMIVMAEHLAMRGSRDDPIDRDGLGSAMAWRWRQESWRGFDPVSEYVFRSTLLGASTRRTREGVASMAEIVGNGAATRVAPLGVLGLPLARVRRAACESARVTVSHPLSQAGAVVQGAGVALAMAGYPDASLDRREFVQAVGRCADSTALSERLRRIPEMLVDPRVDRVARTLGNSRRVIESVPAALLAFLAAPDAPMEVLERAVRSGGDTAAIGSMAGALAGARCGASAMPAELLVRLEDGPLVSMLADALAGQVHIGVSGPAPLPVCPPHTEGGRSQQLPRHGSAR